MNPLDLRGPDFLRFYALCFVVAIVVVYILRQIIRRGSLATANPRANLNAIDLAYLAGGPIRAIQVAVVSLMRRGVIAVKSGGAIDLVEAGTDTRDSALESAVRTAARTKGTMFSHLRRHARDAMIDIETRLVADGFAVSSPARTAMTLLSALILGGVVMLGIAKLIVGLSRNRPVGFLLIELLVAGIGSLLIIFRPPRRTPAGDAALKSSRAVQPSVAPSATPFSLDPLMLAVALGGASALAGTEYAAAREHLRDRNAGSWSGDGGSSCGASSCGGGGGGCGGGGGGCGGCGGGGD